MNNKFQNALAGKAQACPPIWFMRQAGRYHKHYQALKQKYSFMQLCKEPELAAEVAMGPIKDFDFDVAILFSDLLFPLEALGIGLEYNPGPQLAFPLNSANLSTLKSVEEALPFMEFQKAAVALTRQRLPKDKSLIGFVGGPWTLFAYAVEGAHKGDLKGAKTQLPLFQAFNEKMIPFLRGNIELQLQGGAEVVMIFDTAAGELSPQLFRQIVEPGLLSLAESFPGKLGYYSKFTGEEHLRGLRESTHWAGFGFDHRWSMAKLLKASHAGFLQGNFDQALLFSEPAQFETHLQDYIREIKDLSPEERKGWVCGLGHGVLPATPERNVKRFIEFHRENFS